MWEDLASLPILTRLLFEGFLLGFPLLTSGFLLGRLLPLSLFNTKLVKYFLECSVLQDWQPISSVI